MDNFGANVSGKFSAFGDYFGTEFDEGGFHKCSEPRSRALQGLKPNFLDAIQHR
jgi:hypothetical protein